MDISQHKTISNLIDSNPEKLIELLGNSTSLSDIMRSLNANPNNTYARNIVKDFAHKHDIAIPVFDRTMDSNNRVEASKDEKLSSLFVLSEEYVQRGSLKFYILKFDLLPHKCMAKGCCVTNEWNNKRINLHLDHINGNSFDNRLENLRFLCPNCHSQTDTYTGKNAKGYKDVIGSTCLRCGELSKSGAYCRACQPYVETAVLSKEEIAENVANLPSHTELLPLVKEKGKQFAVREFGISMHVLTKYLADETYKDRYLGRGAPRPSQLNAKYPPVEELLSRVELEGYEVLSRELGVSGNAIRKHLKVRTGSYPKTRSRLTKP
jgi:hypothetical protein